MDHKIFVPKRLVGFKINSKFNFKDGEWHSHEIGQMSIQEAAVQVLLLYRVHFPVYNSVLEHTRRSNTFGGRFRSAMGRPGFKLYDIDGQGDQTTALSEMNARILMQVCINDKFF